MDICKHIVEHGKVEWIDILVLGLHSSDFEQFSYLHHALFLNVVYSVPGGIHIVGQ